MKDKKGTESKAVNTDPYYLASKEMPKVLKEARKAFKDKDLNWCERASLAQLLMNMALKWEGRMDVEV